MEPPFAFSETRMQDRYSQCLAELIDIEGGYSNDPVDRGGPTMCGVTWQTYNAYRDSLGLPQQDVRRITRAEIEDLFRRFYWQQCHADHLPPGLDLAVFDFGVNSGVGTAIRKLQVVLGVRADGHLGAVTTAKISKAYIPDLIAAYMDERTRYGRRLPDYWRFGHGWENRWNRIRASALSACGAHVWAAQVAFEPPPAEPDQRSAEQGRAVAPEPAPPVMAEIGAGGGGLTSFGFALPNIIARGWPGGKFSAVGLMLGIAMEPMFWTGVTAIVGAVMFYLWRRKEKRARE